MIIIINISDYEKKAEILKALAHPYRLCITRGLINGKCNVSKIQECLQIPQTNVSHHLIKLKAAGIIRGIRNSNEICYEVIDKDVIKLINTLFEGMDINEKF